MAEALQGAFASPAKRRKMCFAGDGDEHGPCAAKPQPSRLKGDRAAAAAMPRAKQAEPRTPGSKLAAAASAAADGLLASASEALPANLMLLNQLLGGLYVTMPLLRSRGRPTTYQNLQGPVQNYTGRDLQVVHIRQIKALCPEALGWEHVLVTSAASKRQEEQLLLKMPGAGGKAAQGADPAQVQQLFFTRLQQHHQQAGTAAEVPMADLPPPANSKARDCTPSRRAITSSELLPGTPQTAPPAAAAGRARSGSSSGSGSSMRTPPPLQLLASPPPKRGAATCGLAEPSADALMSPPPARTRGANSRKGAAKQGNANGALASSPSPPLPGPLFSPRDSGGGAFGPGSSHTPVRAAAEPQPEASGDGATPLLRPSRLFSTPLAAATPQQEPAPQRPTARHATPLAAGGGDGGCSAAGAGQGTGPAAAGIKARKLTFDAVAPPAAAAAAAKPGAPPAGALEVQKQQRRQKQQEQQAPRQPKAEGGASGITFELGSSAMALLQQVASAQAQRDKAAQQQALDERRALDLLPATFDVLRGVFGERGPCVKPRAEVVALLRQKSTSSTGMSLDDASEQLELMLRFVPEFVRLVNPSGQSLAGMTQSVRINRQLGWPAARAKLMAAAAQARSGGAAAAAAAVAADRERQEQAEAAAVAAAGAEPGATGGGEAPAVDDEPASRDDTLAAADQRASSPPAGLAAPRSAAAGDARGEAALLLGGGGTPPAGRAMSPELLGALSFGHGRLP